MTKPTTKRDLIATKDDLKIIIENATLDLTIRLGAMMIGGFALMLVVVSLAGR